MTEESERNIFKCGMYEEMYSNLDINFLQCVFRCLLFNKAYPVQSMYIV
jgi:hypothetical protein